MIHNTHSDGMLRERERNHSNLVKKSRVTFRTIPVVVVVHLWVSCVTKGDSAQTELRNEGVDNEITYYTPGVKSI